MNKTIIAMTIAAAVAAPMTANAAGTAYAKVLAEISSIDNGTDAVTKMSDSGTGMLGFKGTEELGNGLTMIGKMEFGVNAPDAEILSNRQAYVGLKAGWGTVMMGTIPSPYKYAGGVKYDAFVATSLQSRGVIMTGKVGTGDDMGHNGFQTNSLGFKLMGGKLAINLGLEDATDPAKDKPNSGDVTISYKHKMGKNEIVFAHVAQGADQGDYSATKVAGKFGAVKVQLEAADTGTVANTHVFAAYSMKAAGGSLVVQGGMITGDNAEDTTDVTVGYIKKFTKQARWFAGFRTTDDQGTDKSTVTYGMRFDY